MRVSGTEPEGGGSKVADLLLLKTGGHLTHRLFPG